MSTLPRERQIMNTFGLTDVGRQRSENQDTIYQGRVDGNALVVVADGMGGTAGGAVASEVAVERFVKHIEANVDQPADKLLKSAVEEANKAVFSRAREDPQLGNMGTTLVAAIIQKADTDRGPFDTTIVNVGDSRAYEVNSGIKQITVDQSLVQELVEAGQIDPEDVDDHPKSHILAQSLGTDDTIDPDLYQCKIADTLLLCSDGLTTELPDETIQTVVSDTKPAEAAEELVSRANESGGSDNISVVLAKQEK